MDHVQPDTFQDHQNQLHDITSCQPSWWTANNNIEPFGFLRNYEGILFTHQLS